MAISVASKTQYGDTTDTSTYVTDSWTPTANRLALVAVSSRIASVQPNQPTVSGNGLTWDVVFSEARGSLFRTTVFRAWTGSSPSAGALTVDFDGQNQGSMSVAVSEWDGVDSSGTNGSGAIVQYDGDNGSSSATPTATLPSAVDPANATYFAYQSGVNGTLTPPAGWTELADTAVGAPNQSLQTAWRADAVQSVSPEMTSTTYTLVMVEIKASSGTPVSIAASTAGTSTAAGTLSEGRKMAAVVGATSTVGGSLLVADLSPDLQAAISVTSSVSGFLKTERPIAGSTAGASTLSGTTRDITPVLAGVIAGQSSLSATPSTAIEFGLEIDGTDVINYLLSRSPSYKNTAYSQTGTFSFTLVGEPGDFSVTVEDEITFTYQEEVLFSGIVRNTSVRDANVPGLHYVDVDCQDFSTLPGDNVVDTGGLRTVTSESDAERIDWLFSTYGTKGVTVGDEVQELRATMPTMDFTGMTLGEALEEIGKLTGGSWYVDHDKALHYFDSESNAAPFGLSDDPDGSNTYGYIGLEIPDDSVGLKNAVYVIGDGIADWYEDAASIAAYGRREASLKDERVTVQATLDSYGESFLSENAWPKRTGQVRTFTYGLRAGQTLEITNDDHGFTAEEFRIHSVTAEFRSDYSPIYTVVFGSEPLTLAGQIGKVSREIKLVEGHTSDLAGRVANMSAAGTNLVANSSFETAVSGSWTSGTGWTMPYTSADPFRGLSTARLVRSGSSSGELVTTNYIPVNRGDNWHISFWSKMTAYTAGTAKLLVREYNSSNVLQQTTTVTVTAVESEWTRHKLHFGPEADAHGRLAFDGDTVKIKLAFLADTSPTLTWEVDGVQVERGRLITAYAPTPDELVNVPGEVIIDAAGITIVNGALTVKNPTSTVIIDGTSDMFRIAATGSVTVSSFSGPGDSTNSVSFSSGTVGISHVPAFISFVDSGGWAVQTPFVRLSGSDDGSVVDKWSAHTTYSGGNVTFHASVEKTDSLTSPNITFSYFILKQEAI